MDRFLEGVGVAIAAMPPALSAMVIMGLALGALVYFWRRAGVEASHEKRKADEAQAANAGLRNEALIGRLDGLGAKADKLQGTVDDVASSVAILLDRSGRK